MINQQQSQDKLLGCQQSRNAGYSQRKISRDSKRRDNKKIVEPTSNIPWSFHNLCGNHLQSLVIALGGVYMRKLAPARVSRTLRWRFDSYRVYMMTGSFHIFLFNGTFHVDKIHVWFKIANITHALPVPVYRQTDFTPKWVLVSRLHDTVARFRTGVKFSPRCENRGELTPGWLAPA